jgi:hypothetical protein
MVAGLQTKILIQDLLNAKQKCYPLDCDVQWFSISNKPANRYFEKIIGFFNHHSKIQLILLTADQNLFFNTINGVLITSIT